MEHRSALLAASTAAAAGALAVWALQPRRQRRRSTPAEAAATSFESYLKHHADNPSLAAPPAQPAGSNSFEAYLRVPAKAQAPSPAAAAPPATVPGVAPAGARPVTVLYGTEFGFSREVAQKAAAALAAGCRAWPQLVDMANHPGGLELARCQALLVVCSTQGDGVAPAEARAFCDWLGGGAAPALGGVPFAVAALGDASYAHFARCGRRLDARLQELGGTRLAPRVDVNREDWGAIDGWIAAAVGAVHALPLRTAEELGWEAPGGEGALAAEAARPKGWGKQRPYYATVVAIEGLCRLESADDKNTVRVELDVGDSGLEYEPGDALGIWPANSARAVEELLAELGADGGILVPVPGGHYQDPALDGGATWPLAEALAHGYDLRQPRRELLHLLRTLRDAQGRGVDGRMALNRHVPASEDAAAKVQAESMQAKVAANGDAVNTCAGAANGCPVSADSCGAVSGDTAPANGGAAGAAAAPVAVHGHAVPSAGAQPGCAHDLEALVSDAEAAERYLEPRHVIDVLRDWAPARVPPAELLAALRPLAPRLYSISSSPLEAPARVQVTVAVVRYRSLGVDRAGVCSTQLGERLAPGQRLPVYVARNPDFRLPRSLATPLVMVGPGTGVAPFRAFIQHRLLLAASAVGGAAPGRAALFFGCRRRDQDYLYGAQLERWAAEGAVELHTAFSREQAGKVYVQKRLREQAAAVWQILSLGGHFYVCGDAASMAGEVERALVEIVAARLPATDGCEDGVDAVERRARGRAYVEALAAEGRYQRDVWF